MAHYHFAQIKTVSLLSDLKSLLKWESGRLKMIPTLRIVGDRLKDMTIRISIPSDQISYRAAYLFLNNITAAENSTRDGA